MHPLRALAPGLLVAAVGAFVAPPPAVADCISPSLDRSAEGLVDRGTELTIGGTGFGTSCYDTGPPPAGQGVLGRRLTGIEVVIAQAGEEHVVARGDADDRYELEATAVVPADLSPGPATMFARWDDGRTADFMDVGLSISEVAPVTDGAATEPEAFGESPDAQVEVERDDGDGSAFSIGWTGAIIIGGVGAAVATGVILRRRQEAAQ